MISMAMIAFLGEMVNKYIMQLAFILQKLAHRHMESTQKRNLVNAAEDSLPKRNEAANKDHFTMVDKDCSSNQILQTSSGKNLDVVEKDKDNSMSVYCSWRFIVGLFLMGFFLCFHIYFIQFLDLTLMAANSANSIVATLILSTAILGEKFIWKYDGTALVFISAGCVTLVLNANTSEQTEYTAEEVKDLLCMPRTLVFISFCMLCILLSVIVLRFALNRLRQFE